MTETDGEPTVGDGRDMLGVRPGEIKTNLEDGNKVRLNAGGLSTNVCLCSLHPLIVPAHLRSATSPETRGFFGKGATRLWRTGDGAFESAPINEELLLNVKGKPGHAYVEPRQAVTLEEYQGFLANTRNQWFIDEQTNDQCPFCSQP